MKRIFAFVLLSLIIAAPVYADPPDADPDAPFDEETDPAEEAAEDAEAEAATAEPAEEPAVEPTEDAEAAEEEVTEEEPVEEAEPEVEPAPADLQPEPEAEQPLTTDAKSDERLGYDIAKYTTLGVGLGLVATGIAYSVFAKDKQDEYNDLYAEKAFIDEDLRDEADQNATIATATYASGGAVLAVSVTLFILDALDVGEHPMRRFGVAPAPGGDQPGMTLVLRY